MTERRILCPQPNEDERDLDGWTPLPDRYVTDRQVEDLRSAYKARGDMGWRTATASPICLVVDKDWIWIDFPGPWEHHEEETVSAPLEEGEEWLKETGAGLEVEKGEDGTVLYASASDLEGFSIEGEHYYICPRVCGVYLSVKEAQDEIDQRHYNYSPRVHTYAMPAKGSLATLVDYGAGLVEAAALELDRR